MKKSRFGKSLAIALVMGACFTAGAYADDALVKVEAYLRPDFTVKVNGRAIALPEDVLIYKGSSYLPFKMMATLLGANADWDEATKSILVTTNNNGTIPGGHNPGTGNGSEPGYREMVLGDVVRYNLIYNNINYPVLANMVKSDTYFRWTDLQAMPFDLSGVILTTEKLTKETYVHVDQVIVKWGGKVTMGIKNDPIYTGNYTPGQKKAIESFVGTGMTAFTVQQLAENEYYAFVQRMDRKYVGYTLKLTPFSNDYWSISGATPTEFSLTP
ncbi:MAG: hypothetical protein K0Q73_8797 [Paenibacillus sp.]|jgi:hypothetical protein|nr:hypothetical protein [Paenibacillus sp.]